MSNWVSLGAIALLVVSSTGCEQDAQDKVERYGFGSPLTAEEVSSWDIDVGPEGLGLPAGQGTAVAGEQIYVAQCAACHGEFGEGSGRFPALIGTPASLVGARTSKTVGGFWPYSSTLWDYIYRAMPFGNAQSLSADDVYAVTAYILSLNDIIADTDVMNAQTLPQVQMPNRHGFITATGPDIKVGVCMQDCTTAVTVVSRAGGGADSQQGE